MALTFDGETKIIQLDETTLFYTPQAIYSRWKDWAVQGDNAKYLEAFRIVGGDDLGGGATAPTFVFLRNDYGWRIKKPESDINVTINGNLVSQDPMQGFDLPPDGAFSPSLTLNLSNVASVDLLGQVLAGGSTVGAALNLLTEGDIGGGLTEQQERDLKAILVYARKAAYDDEYAIRVAN